jgi:hypothetical protein
MLTQKQKRSVVRALIKAYYTYRDLPYLKVCREVGIYLTKNDDECGGEAEAHWNEPDTMHLIDIPGKAQKNYKEHVFWHEFCHLFLEKCGVFQSRPVGYQGYIQMFNLGNDYWDQERLCEAFADTMILYRHDLVKGPVPNLQEFLFADQSSVGYAEAATFSMRRIETHINEAGEQGRNIDLTGLKAMLKIQERWIAGVVHQQWLPTQFYEHHQCPGARFVDEEADFERRYQLSRGKDSWKWVHPEEQRLTDWAYGLIEAQNQLALFEEVAQADKAKFKEAIKRFDLACKKFQRT